ncbi:MAG TPA: hypothetical protein VHO28_10625 [Ignavibacteriales bacterium]|nr:hypothetical protein [Ignavibacteriales bacterium]
MIDCYNNAKNFIVRHEKGDFSLSISENGENSFTAVFIYSDGADDKSGVKTAVFAGENLGDLLAEYNSWMRRCMKGPYLLKEIINGEDNSSV